MSCGELAHRVHQGQRPRHRVRHLREHLEVAGDLVAVLGAAGLRQRQPDQVVGGELGQERLGGGDTDLGPGVRVQHRVGFPRDLRAVGVADGEHPGPLPAGVPDGLQGVRGLPGLADRDDQGVPVQHRIAVAELAGHLDLDREPAPVLDGVLGDQPGVVGGAAGDHEHLVDRAQVVVGQPLLVEHDAGAVEVAQQSVGDRTGLLSDLLVHEEVEAALLRGRQVPVDVELLEVRLAAGEGGDLVPVRVDHHQLVLAELDGLPGVRDERGDVAGHEHLAIADADHQRGVAARRDQHLGGVDVHRDQGERAVQGAADGGHAGRQVTGGRAVGDRLAEQVRDHLGVGVAAELDARTPRVRRRSGHEVLDDPVVDDGDPPVHVGVRVRVAVGRTAVGGPAGVSHAGRPGQRDLAGVDVRAPGCRAAPAFLAVCSSPSPSRRRRRPSRSRGTRAGRVRQHQGECLTRSGVSDDAAHPSRTSGSA